MKGQKASNAEGVKRRISSRKQQLRCAPSAKPRQNAPARGPPTHGHGLAPCPKVASMRSATRRSASAAYAGTRSARWRAGTFCASGTGRLSCSRADGGSERLAPSRGKKARMRPASYKWFIRSLLRGMNGSEFPGRVTSLGQRAQCRLSSGAVLTVACQRPRLADVAEIRLCGSNRSTTRSHSQR